MDDRLTLIFILVWWVQTAWAGMPEQQIALPHGDRWHQLAHALGDLVGWQTLLLAAGIGLVVIYQKKIKQWFTPK